MAGQTRLLLQVCLVGFFTLAVFLGPASSGQKKSRRVGNARTNMIEVEVDQDRPAVKTVLEKSPTDKSKAASRIKVKENRIKVKENNNMSALTKKPTNLRRNRIFCKVGLYLVVKRRGNQFVLTGSEVFEKTQAGIFEIQSFGSSVVKIKNVKYNRYIMMDKKGRVTVTQKKKSTKTLFRENQEHNLFSSYASFRYYKKDTFDMFLGLSKAGKVRSGKLTNSGQDGIQFLVSP